MFTQNMFLRGSPPTSMDSAMLRNVNGVMTQSVCRKLKVQLSTAAVIRTVG